MKRRAAGGPGLIPGVVGSLRFLQRGSAGQVHWLAEHETSPGGRLHTRYPDQDIWRPQ